MVRVKLQGLSTSRSISVVFTTIVLVLCSISVFLLTSDFHQTINRLGAIFIEIEELRYDSATANKQQIVTSLSHGSNATHLWSLRLADQDYFRLANLLPCQTVEYTGGPEPVKMNSCDYSPSNEFSIPNILQAQKWLYEHQHPADCSAKRFAIIHNFASSGFGSTVHQIALAFGKALAEDRIAIYERPGNWVRNIQSSIVNDQ